MTLQPPRRGTVDRISALNPRQRELLEARLRERGESLTRLPIPRRPPGDDPLPLSFAQQRLWFLDQLQPGAVGYQITVARPLESALDCSLVERALLEVCRRHESLRTTFPAIDGAPVQKIHAHLAPQLALIDVTGLALDQRRETARRLCLRQRHEPFSLESGPLWRVTLVRSSSTGHELLLTMHHIVSDGWSMEVLFRELAVLYEALSTRRPAALPELPIQYADFAVWQRQWLQGEVLERQLGYWKEQLAGSPAELDLPIDRPRPPVQSFHGAMQSLVLGRTLSAAVRDFGRREKATLFISLLAAMKALLFRHTGEEDLVVGSPVANRNREEIEGLIGFFANTLVLRSHIDGETTFRGAVDRVRRVVVDAQASQDLPFERLVAELAPERSLQHTPVFQVAFVLQQQASEELASRDPKPGLYGPMEQETKFDLTLDIQPGAEVLTAVLEYSTALFEHTTASRLLRHWETLLASAMADPDAPISKLRMLSPSEEHQVAVEWGASNAVAPVPGEVWRLDRIFERRAAAKPDRVAVAHGGEVLTYGELDARADRLALRLLAEGAGPQRVVGLSAERGVEMLVGILGILKSGAAYLPLDPVYPVERLRFMLEDSATPCVVVTAGAREQELTAAGLRVLPVEPLAAHPAGGAPPSPPAGLQADDLAYVIYTSGSTGKPKGVQVTHANAVRLFAATRTAFDFGPHDTWTLFHSFAFDFSVWEIWGALLFGGRLLVVPYEISRSPDAFHALLARERVTVLNQTPSAFRQLIAADAVPAADRRLSLRHVVFGGEALDFESLRPWFRRHGDATPRLVNMYGITETTVHVTYLALAAGPLATTRGSAVGRPISDLAVHLLDPRLSSVPVGVPAEIFVAGAGVARGYLGRPALTAERFVPDPFSRTPGARLYRSGDLARWLGSGDLDYLGRIDRQVKVRGFRIELAEIEEVLAAHPGVAEVVVLACEESAGDVRLVAYVVARPPVEGGEVAAPTATTLRDHARAELPSYMVPSVVVFLDRMPLTPNGKLDRRALPAPDVQARGEEATYSAPRNEVERGVAEIWREVLAVDRVGLDDNFFDLGGHSLLLMRVQLRLEQATGRKVPMLDLFRYPTVRALAERVGGGAPVAVAAALAEPARRAAADDSVAIVSMAGRFPGAGDVEELWRNLREGRESITFFDREQLLAAGMEPAIVDDPTFVPARGILTEIDQFDAGFFGFSPREAQITDPQHRLFLEIAWQALETAGYDPERVGGPVGVFAGVSFNTYWWNLFENPEVLQAVGTFQALLGNDKDFLPTRTSYKLNLKGPSINVQAGCSTSLVAVHLACQSLLAGECDMALAGGSSVAAEQRGGYMATEGGIGSPDGHCRAFDAAAEGTVFGSGVAVVALKRLSDALADGDTIRAVIRGSAVNNDGSLKVGFTAPSIEGQAEVIRLALSAAAVAPQTVGYVETHGTATVLGDPIEIAALAQAFGPVAGGNPTCAIGSVKTNVGHLDAAAGVTGLIKAALTVERAEIPPSLHFESPNPAIDFDASPFFVAAHLQPWPLADGPRRAGVSSFGIGGTNVHVVLEQAPAAPPATPSRPWKLLLLSARAERAIDAMSERLAAHLEEHPEVELADVAYTLQLGRRRFDRRRFAVCREAAEAAALLAARSGRWLVDGASAAARGVAFLFPGQGAQYPGMSRGLYDAEPVFRREVDRSVAILEPLLGLDLRQLLFPAAGAEEEAARRLEQTALAQPALFLVEHALARLWMEWGLEPEAMVGHSVGEITAACLAEVFELEDALRLVALRGRLMQALPRGDMLAVPRSEAEVLPWIGSELSLAAVNGPERCVVSGPERAVAALASLLAEQGIEGRILHTSHAFHSAMMDPILEPFGSEVARMKLSAPRRRFVSSLTGSWITAAEATDPSYWVRQLRSTVRFSDALRTVLGGEELALLEVGPGRVLTTFARQHPDWTAARTAVTSLRHPQDDVEDLPTLLEALGRLWLSGVEIDWRAFWGEEKRRRVPLPPYPFERQRYFIDRRPPGAAEKTRGRGGLRKRTNPRDWFYLPFWKPALAPAAVSGPESGPWLVLTDGLGLAAEVAARLAGAGCDVTLVEAGASFERRTERHFSIRPASPEDYAELLSLLHRAGRAPRRIVHAWSLTEADERPPAEDLFDQLQSLGLYSLLHLAQALIHNPGADPVRITVLASQLQPVTGDEVLRPEKATLLGACKVITQEYPDLVVQSLDVVPTGPGAAAGERLVGQLLAELAADAADRFVALRGARRWVQGFEPVRLEEPATLGLRQGGVYLITGGLGSIGLLLAGQLAERYAARLVLVGRSPLPEREGWEEWLSTHDEGDAVSARLRRLLALEAAGGEVMVAAVDVADRAGLAAVVAAARQRFGALHGVIHAAGATGANAFPSVEETGVEHCERHFASKVRGLLALDAALTGSELDFAVLFSSLSAVLGGLGFLAYSAANSYMDAFAARRGNEPGGVRWLSVDWDGWRFDATASSASGVGAAQAEIALTPEDGLAAFARLLGVTGVPRLVVSTADLQARIDQWLGGVIEAEKPGEAEAETAPLLARPQLSSDFAAPRDEDEQTIAELWQQLLGVDQIGIHDSFFELGGDSLLATQLFSRLRRLFQVELSLRTLFEDPTVAGLTAAVAKGRSEREEAQKLEALLAEIEALSSADVDRELAQESSHE